MSNSFLSIGYVAMTLIKEKSKIFNENFVTISELNQFCHFMQKEFNNKDLGIAITSNLSREDFNVFSGIVIPSDRCCYDVDNLPNNIVNILMDQNLILQFFTELERRKLQTLENFYSENSKSCTKNKRLSLR